MINENLLILVKKCSIRKRKYFYLLFYLFKNISATLTVYEFLVHKILCLEIYSHFLFFINFSHL